MTAAYTQYQDYANPELLDKIPLNAGTVLDVGCGQGALAQAYLRRNPAARMLGVDIDPVAAAEAATRMTEIVCGDIEAEPMPFTVPGGVDCIVYGDVLEHMRDPWALLAAHVQHLAPDGTILVCIPNVEHWSFALSLLRGQFDYADRGLFDRTHLRWFTPRTMGKALSDAGLALADVSPRPINPEKAEQFVNALGPGLRALGIEPGEYLNRATPLQFIWRARKAPPPRLLVNATMLAPQGGVSDVRILEPMRALRSDTSVYTAVMPEPELAPQLPDTPRVAVLHRPLLMGEAGLARVRSLLAKGYVIVVEFDDDPSFMAERGLDLSQLLTFKAVHAVQTSTPVLAETLRAENPEVGMFRNAVFELPAPRNFNDPDRLTMIFAAINREEDWAPLMPALNEVARAVGPRLQIQVVHDQAFYEALETPHKTFTPMCDYATYLKMLGDAEIALMPLADNRFNRAKSDLKFIEASACRVAALASPVVYAGSVEDGRTGMLFSDARGFRSALLRLLAYPEAARRMADAARDYVARERMLAYQVGERIAWYRSLWERKPELDAALRQRVPELFT